MRVLVTGGGGFIGSHVVDAFRARLDEVTILDDFSTGSPSNVSSDARVIDADIADVGTVGAIAAAGPDVIVHAAAQASVPRSMADPARDRAVNVVGMEHVIEGAKRTHGCRVVYLSTGGAIYGDTAEPASEEHPPWPRSFYGAHKYLAERYLEYSGLSYAIARLANVYGPRQRSDLEGGVVAVFAERLRAGLPITIHGSGGQQRDFVHASDVARALVMMADCRVSGLWNVGTGTQMSINGLLDRLQDVIGSAISIVHEPSREGDVFNSCLNVSRIRVDLGWRPAVRIDQGLTTL